ncbi:MAG: transcription termination/antitermination NusG family protein [Sedimentisphaerales bacterium]|nr:transcription termination/antitermination NusG family protein [Sedimentisphaerales bacterium]
MKESDNPPISFPAGTPIAQFTGRWWVAHTRSRNEKALAHDLLARQVSYFLPMTWNIRRHRHRTFKALLPVFSGYLFFCGTESDRLAVLKTNRVAGIIEVVDQARLVAELSQIEQALKSGVPLLPHRYIKEGQWCRVTAGPLMGLEGIIIQTKNLARLVLQVEMLGQATYVDIDMRMVEPIEAPSYKQSAVRRP